MKLVSLNIWGGRAGREKLLPFFEAHKDDVDVFCLQEVWADRYEMYEGTMAGGRPIDHSMVMTHVLQEISAILTDHTPYFHPSFYDSYGQCTFVRSTIPVNKAGDIFVHRERGYIPTDDLGNHARNMQYVEIEQDGVPLTIMNLHGLWNGKGKTDCTERLEQSDKILAFIDTLTTSYILCGDFNLLPDTESLKKFEAAGMRNLIAEYGITSTRTPLYDKDVLFADYAFVNEGVTVQDFKVLPDVVSDHAPLQLTIA